MLLVIVTTECRHNSSINQLPAELNCCQTHAWESVFMLVWETIHEQFVLKKDEGRGNPKVFSHFTDMAATAGCMNDKEEEKKNSLLNKLIHSFGPAPTQLHCPATTYNISVCIISHACLPE